MSDSIGITVSVTRRPLGDRKGFTLLEVLVALGIIVGALAGIAALLPAAGSRLAEATDIDRAGTMAANAQAEIWNRGLTSASLWSGVDTPAIVFGEGLTSDGTSTVADPSIGVASAAAVSSRIDPTTGFQLRDVLQTTGTGDVVVTGTGWEPGICWGCMLSSTAAPTAPGATVRMTTVVFRKPAPEVKQFTLTPRSGVFDVGAGGDMASDRRRFLAGCSWLLVVGAGEPRWFQIASSWTANAAGQASGNPTGLSSLTLSGDDVPAGPLQAFGFDGLLRLDERFVNLQ